MATLIISLFQKFFVFGSIVTHRYTYGHVTRPAAYYGTQNKTLFHSSSLSILKNIVDRQSLTLEFKEHLIRKNETYSCQIMASYPRRTKKIACTTHSMLKHQAKHNKNKVYKTPSEYLIEQSLLLKKSSRKQNRRNKTKSLLHGAIIPWEDEIHCPHAMSERRKLLHELPKTQRVKDYHCRDIYLSDTRQVLQNLYLIPVNNARQEIQLLTCILLTLLKSPDIQQFIHFNYPQIGYLFDKLQLQQITTLNQSLGVEKNIQQHNKITHVCPSVILYNIFFIIATYNIHIKQEGNNSKINDNPIQSIVPYITTYVLPFVRNETLIKSLCMCMSSATFKKLNKRTSPLTVSKEKKNLNTNNELVTMLQSCTADKNQYKRETVLSGYLPIIIELQQQERLSQLILTEFLLLYQWCALAVQYCNSISHKHINKNQDNTFENNIMYSNHPGVHSTNYLSNAIYQPLITLINMVHAMLNTKWNEFSTITINDAISLFKAYNKIMYWYPTTTTISVPLDNIALYWLENYTLSEAALIFCGSLNAHCNDATIHRLGKQLTILLHNERHQSAQNQKLRQLQLKHVGMQPLKMIASNDKEIIPIKQMELETVVTSKMILNIINCLYKNYVWIPKLSSLLLDMLSDLCEAQLLSPKQLSNATSIALQFPEKHKRFISCSIKQFIIKKHLYSKIEAKQLQILLSSSCDSGSI